MRVSDVSNYYNKKYISNKQVDTFRFREDEIKAENLNIKINEWASKKYQGQLVAIHSPEHYTIPAFLPEDKAILHINCNRDLSLSNGASHKMLIKSDSHKLFTKVDQKMKHDFNKGEQYTFFKLILSKKSIQVLMEESGLNISTNQAGFSIESGFCTIEMKRIIEQLQQSHRYGSLASLFFDSKVNELLCLHLFQRQKQESSSNGISPLQAKQIRNAKEIIEKSFMNPPTINALARMVGASETMLKKNFKHILGTTIYGYLQDYRMNVALSLLKNTDILISEVAFESGYEHSSHFITSFKRTFGISPGAYRRKTA